MKLRSEIEPDIKTAEKLHPYVNNIIIEYTDYVDKYGDEDEEKYNKIIHHLSEITNKDIANGDYNIWEYWEADGDFSEALKVCLPEPNDNLQLTLSEVTELVSRIKNNHLPDHLKVAYFMEHHYLYEDVLSSYYRKLLALNLKKYHPKVFNRNKNKQGNWFEYDIDEIVSIIF